MCKHRGKDNNHLFLHCAVTRLLALLCDAFFGDGVVRVLAIW